MWFTMRLKGSLLVIILSVPDEVTFLKWLSVLQLQQLIVCQEAHYVSVCVKDLRAVKKLVCERKYFLCQFKGFMYQKMSTN